MKLNRLFCLFSFLIIFSWASHAMENQDKDSNKLEGLQTIVRSGFPSLTYNLLRDLYSNIDTIFQNANNFKQVNSSITMFPDEIIINILHNYGVTTQPTPLMGKNGGAPGFSLS